MQSYVISLHIDPAMLTGQGGRLRAQSDNLCFESIQESIPRLRQVGHIIPSF